MSLRRAVRGLLAQHIANDATNPFVVAHWTGVNLGGGLITIVSGDLVIEVSGGSSWGGARYNNLASRTKQLVQGRISNNSGAARFVGIASNFDTTGAQTWYHSVMSFQRTPELVLQQKRVAGVNTSLGSGLTGAAAKSLTTFHRIAHFVDGVALPVMHSFTDVFTEVATSVHGLATGQAGLVTSQAVGLNNARMREFFVCSGRFLTVEGLPSGHKAKVRNSAAVTLAEATESGGIASVDMLAVDFTATHDLVVTDAADTIIDTVVKTDDLWGGDVWDFLDLATVDGTFVDFGLSRAGTKLIFADANNAIQEVNRESFAAEGAWLSTSLNRSEDKGADHTIKQVWVEFISNDVGGTFEIHASGDGGTTFPKSKTFTIVDTDGAVEEEEAAFNITGQDPRVKIVLKNTNPFMITSMKVKLIPRRDFGR